MRGITSDDLLHSELTRVNNYVLYISELLRVDLKFPHCKEMISM